MLLRVFPVFIITALTACAPLPAEPKAAGDTGLISQKIVGGDTVGTCGFAPVAEIGGCTATLNINRLASPAAVSSTIGTIFFSSAANVGTVSVPTAVSISAGNLIQVVGGSPLDASLDGVVFNIKGTI